MLDGQEHTNELKKKFEGLEMTPPADAWSAIESGIQTRRRFPWFWMLSGLVAVLVTGTILFMSQGDNPQEDSVIAQMKNADYEEVSNPTKSHFSDSNKATITNKESRTLESDVRSEREPANKNHASTPNVERTTSQAYLPAGTGSLSPATSGTYPLSGGSAGAEGSRQSTEGGEGGNPTAATEGKSSPSSPGTPSGNEGTEGSESHLTGSTQEENNTTSTKTIDGFLQARKLKSSYFTNPGPPGSFRPFEKEEKSSFLKRLSLDLGLGISSFNIAPDKTTSTTLSTLVRESNQKQFGFGLNATVNVDISTSIMAYAGIDYTQLKYQSTFLEETLSSYTYNDTISFQVIYDSIQQPIDTIWNINQVTQDTTLLTPAYSNNAMQIVAIPFGFGYRQSLGAKSLLEFKLGGLFSIYQRHKGTVLAQEDQSSSPADQSFRLRGNLALTGGIRYLYHFTPQHAVYAEPWVRFGLNNFSQAGFTYKTKLHQYGLSVGYRFHF